MRAGFQTAEAPEPNPVENRRHCYPSLKQRCCKGEVLQENISWTALVEQWCSERRLGQGTKKHKLTDR